MDSREIATLQEVSAMRLKELQRLAREVKEMRQWQKNYFTTRDKDVLSKSKAKERQVDGMVEEILKDHQQRDLGL